MFPADQELPVSRLQFFSDILHNCSDSSCERIQADGFIGKGEKKKVFLSGFLAAFARSGCARIMVFKSNLIQAGWLRSRGVWLLWMGLLVFLLGCQESKVKKGLKFLIN